VPHFNDIKSYFLLFFKKYLRNDAMLDTNRPFFDLVGEIPEKPSLYYFAVIRTNRRTRKKYQQKGNGYSPVSGMRASPCKPYSPSWTSRHYAVALA